MYISHEPRVHCTKACIDQDYMCSSFQFAEGYILLKVISRVDDVFRKLDMTVHEDFVRNFFMLAQSSLGCGGDFGLMYISSEDFCSDTLD